MKKGIVILLYLISVYLVFYWPTLKSSVILESGNDARRFGYPVRVYLSEKLHEGIFPFWTERMLSGYPIYADMEAGYLNPVNLAAIYILGPFVSYKLLHLLLYLAGSLSFMLFLKSRLKTTLGVVVAHFIYFFSFFSLFHQQHFAITYAFYLFPCLLYFLETYNNTRRIKYLYLYFFLLLFLLYFGAFQMSFIVLVVSLLYLLIFGALNRQFIGRSVIPCCVFLCLLIPMFVSYFGLYDASERVATRGLWLEGSFSPQVILNLFYPFNYGFGSSYMGTILNRDYLMHEVYIYIGISGSILAILGMIFSKLEAKTNKLLLFFVVSFLILGYAKANPILSTLNPPIFSLFRYWGRLAFITTFSLSIYSGHFVDQLSELTWKRSVRKTNSLFLLVSVLYLVILELLNYPKLEVLSLFRLWKRKDFTFTYVDVYLVLLLLFLALLFFSLRSKNHTYTKYVLVSIPILELAFFGKLALKDAFVDVRQIKTDLSNTETTYSNKRLVVTDADVIGNKTLYYKFWSPFGYVSSLNKDYSGKVQTAGFESSRRPILTNTVQDGFKNVNLHEKLADIGVEAIVDSQNTLFYQNLNSAMFYPAENTANTSIIEKERSEERYVLDVASNSTVKISSYIRYDEGWKVVWGNQPIEVHKEGLFISFILPKGSNTVEIKYIPSSLYKSLGTSFAAAAFLLSVTRFIKRR
jgi:hypothetical protein